jgi:hypothetical protein
MGWLKFLIGSIKSKLVFMRELRVLWARFLALGYLCINIVLDLLSFWE